MEAATVVAKLEEVPLGKRVLDCVGELGNVWLVGGAVRDLILGRSPLEVDLLVEGQLDEVLALLGGSQQRFDRFDTATVELEEGTVDIAASRSETYPHPGALPVVAPAAVSEDILRRDFTINAVAVNLDQPTFVAHPDALADLSEGIVRVLHDQSFADDPTRVWRCARYAVRLGFQVDQHTAELAAAAGPGMTSGERFGHELRLSLRETDPTQIFTLVQSLNPAALIEGFEPRPSGLSSALDLLPQDASRELTTLAACCAGVEMSLLTRWLDYMQFSADERDLVAAASRWVTGEPLRAADRRSQIGRAARGAPIEAVALAGGANARLWIEELRFVKLEIDGDDLIATGVARGPLIGSALEHTLDLTLDGEVRGRQEQIDAALTHVEQAVQGQ